MASYNLVVLMGNLTRDIELRYIPSGTAVADMGLAINSRRKVGETQEEETTFVDITLWGKTAETCAQYLRKGSGAHVEGRLQLDTWDDKDGGGKRSKLKVVARSVQFIGGPGVASDEDKPTTETNTRQYSAPEAETEPVAELTDDEIPF